MRKKTLSMFAALFMCACGAWGQTQYTTFTTSPAPVDGKWVNGTKFYTVKVQRKGYLASDRLDTDGLLLNNQAKPTNDAGKWAFVQTENGIQMFNKAAGTGMVLTFGNNYCYMAEDLEAARSYFDCITTNNSKFLAGYECFKIAGDNNDYWNEKDNGHLAIWQSDQALWGWGSSATNPGEGDGGSQFKIELIEEYDSETAVIHEEFGTLLANANNTWDLNNVPQQLSDALITDPSWFESDFTESSEGDITKLIDNDAKTFWHSKWSGGNVGTHVHYLQVNLSEAIDGEIVMKMTRRDNNGQSCGDDNPTVMSVEASSSHDGTFALVPGSTMDLPFNADKVGEVVSGTFTLTEPKQYLRFFADKTNGAQRGYWHCGEFQLYKVIKPSINSLNPEKAATLAAAIEKAAALTNPTQEDLNELQAAFDAYKEDLVTEPSTPVDPVVSEAEKEFKAAYNELKALVDQYVESYDEESESYTFKVENLSDDAKNELIEDYWTIIGYAENGAGYPESDEAFASSTDILKKSLADLQAALAETTPTEEHFPNAGEYYVTFTGKASGRKNHLYNDLTQPDGYTLQSDAPEVVTNNYVWRVLVEGNSMTLRNGQGTTMQVMSNGKAVVLNELGFETHNNAYYLKVDPATGIKSDHNCLNVSGGTQKNAAGTPALTTWTSTAEGGNASDNLWDIEEVNYTDVYNVVVNGKEDGYAILGNQYAGNNGFFLTASAEGVKAKAIENYNTSISTVGNTITVTYAPDETLIATRQDAIVAALAKVGQLGYPRAEAEAVTALNNYTVTADNYAASTTLLANLYACTDVVMPELGKSYRVAFRKSNGSLQYINGAATSATADDATVLTLAASETGNEFAYTLAGADGSYLTNKGVKSDATTVRAASINLKFGQLSASQYVTLDASKYYGAFALYTEKRYDRDALGCLVMGESANSFDGANAPFFNGSYTSAIVLEEVESTPEVDPEALAAAKEAYEAIHLKYATIGVSYEGYAYENEAVAAIIDELMEAVEWFPSEANPTIEQYNTVTATAIAAMEDAEAKLAELLPDFTAALAEVDEMIAKCNEVAKEYGQVAASGTAAGDKMSDLVDTAYGYGFYLARPTNVEEAKIAVSTMKDAIKAFYESCTIQILVNVIEEGAENALEKVEAIKAGILQTMDADETKE